jgi:hypothetical protein
MLAVVLWPTKPADPFREKYEQIDSRTTFLEATTLLGPAEWVLHPGGSLGDTIGFWSDEKARIIKVTWNLFGKFSDKEFIKQGAP